MSVVQTTNWVVAMIVLLGTGALGVYDASSGIGTAASGLQRSVSIAVLTYGVLGLLAGGALALRKRSSLPLTYGWAAGAVYAASVASFAYSDPTFSREGTIPGVVGAAVGSLLLCGLVLWAVRIALRSDRLPRGAPARDIPR
jgi:hypothetical protein